MNHGRRGLGAGVLLGLLFAAGRPVAGQTADATRQAAATLDVPPAGDTRAHTLAQGETQDWRLEAAANDFVEIAVVPVGIVMSDAGEFPLVTVTAPDGRVVDESEVPSLSLSIDLGAQIVVSFVADRAGPYRLRLAARRQVSPSLPYQLVTRRRGPAMPDDRVRLDVNRLWREGARLFASGGRESRLAALQKFDAALRALEAIDEPEGVALTLTTMTAVHYGLSDAAAGRAATLRALDLWRRLGRTREQGVALSDLGVLAYLAYQHPEARHDYDQALTLLRSSGDVEGEAVTLVRMGWVEFAAGEMARVIQLNQEATPLFERAGSLGGASVSLNDLGRAFTELGDVSLALDAYQRVLAMRPGDVEPRGAAVVLMRIGQLYLNMAEWQPALDALQQALPLARRGNDPRNEASILSNIGFVYSRMGDGDATLRYLEPALELARRSGNRTAEGNVLAGLGVEAYLRGDLDQGRSFFQQALDVQTAIADVRGQAVTLRYLANTHLAAGRARDAFDRITQSLEKSQATGVSPSGLATLAAVHDALGDAPQAQAAYERAVARARQIRALDQQASVLTLYGGFLTRQGRLSDARDRLEQAVAIHETLRAGLADADQRMSYASRSTGPYALYIDTLMALERQSPGEGFAREAFQVAERARGRGLLELLAASDVDVKRGVDPELVDRERALRRRLNAKAAVQTSLLMTTRDERRLERVEQEIDDLARTWRDTATLIRQQSPGYAALTEPQPVTAAEAARLLDGHTVLLETAFGDKQSWLFAITESTFESFALPPRQTLDEAAREVHRLLTARQPVAREPAAARQARVTRADRALADRAAALSDAVLGPIAGKLNTVWRGRRLAVVPTGGLEYVPLAALPLPGRPRAAPVPVVARHEIVTLASASSLALLRREGPRRAGSKTIAVLADPVFAADDPRVAGARVSAAPDGTRADRGGTPLARLPFSRIEAQAVAAQAPPSSVLQATDFDASLELATSGRLGDYRIVHLATHGVIDTNRPELSGLALSLVDRDGRTRDGFLRLNTIYNLRLAADLVVLSACQTALGKEVAGEGLVGLTRGFMQAGARRVIASLWQVNDAATAELMKRFYAAHLQRGLPASAALRLAQRGMAADPRWSAPYFWAGFVLQGDWQP